MRDFLFNIYNKLDIMFASQTFFNVIQWDKILHFLMISIIGIFLVVINKIIFKKIKLDIIILIILFISIWKEIYDYFFRTSWFSCEDLLFDLLWILFVITIVYIWKLLNSSFQK